jgi:hypothetical protein
MDPRQDEQRAEARFPRRQHIKGRRLAGEGVETTPQIREHLDGHSGADAAGVDELAVIRVVAQQQRAEMRSRAFRVGPADDDEFLAVEPFGLAP